MDPRKIAIVAAVAVTAGLAGCSADHRGRAASAAQVPSTLLPAPAPTTTTTTAETTTTSTSTTTTVAPTSTTRAGAGAVTSAPTTRALPPTTTAPCPSNLASQLASTGSARQLITVTAAGWGTSAATVELWQRSGGCWTAVAGPWSGFIGENGFTNQKVEGDGRTPTGLYGLGPVMYGNAANPGTREPYHVLQCGDWWDEDPNSPQYNTFQAVGCDGGQPRQTFGGGSEALWQETAPYPSFAVIDYNTGPIIKGAGSGIFFHAATGGPTVGCVSVPLADLDLALRWLDPSQAPAFVMGPADEITRF
ncbi:MAG TPA: L,D-transpeptidase family protein [Acidimicrobiales bacterium]|nr:L,D-transpeptidase family protein [Acidimicrobiales bacterium]